MGDGPGVPPGLPGHADRADQGGSVVWITGLPASGKSTLAARIASRLRELGALPVVLDGDDVREVLVPPPGYDAAGRDAFYRTLAGLAALVARQGAIAIVPATAHLRRWRDDARARAPRFVEVYVATPVEECRRRDPKGLYARLGAGGAMPGAGAAYEPPLHPEVVADGGDDASAASAVLDRLR